MSGSIVLLRAGGWSIAFQNPREKLPVLEKAAEPPCLESKTEREAVRLHAHPLSIPLDYFNFNTSLRLVELQASPVPAGAQDPPTILRSAEWVAFQGACEQAEVDLTQSLQNLEHSWMKGYLLGQEKKIVQDRLRAGLQQVQWVCEAAIELAAHPTPLNWQWLKETLDQLADIRLAATQSPGLRVAEVAAASPPTAWLARAWEEVQYFLGPVFVTGWGILNKLGILTEALTKNVPIVGGLTSLMLTLYQRMAVRIIQLKTEDQEKLMAVCHALTAAFEKMKGKHFMENIQNNTAQTLHNTAITAQQALNAAYKADETQQAVQDQSQIINTLIQDQAALKAEVTELKDIANIV